jgi:hypothetical protein
MDYQSHMYQIKKYQDLTDKELETFWQTIESEFNKDTSPAMANMFSNSWTDEKHQLRYLLEKNSRFSQGAYYILFDNDLPVASGGVHCSPWHKNIAMAGIRTWVHTDYRNKMLAAGYILPACKSWAMENDCSIVTLTFNEYNKNLIKIWTRTRAGESADRIKQRQPKHLFYNGVIEVDFPLEIYYTKQWLIYEKLIDDVDFDWEEIKWKK